MNMTDIEPYDLAMLAAQLMRRQNSPLTAVETALSLLDQAKLRLDRVRIRALAESPEAHAESERREAQRMAELRIPYEKGVELVTGVDRWSGDYGAIAWFKRFLQWKAARQEKTPDAIEVRVEAWLATYRGKGFTGTEAKKLQAEYDQWRNKGKQGRVKKKRDGRLRAMREAKKAKQEKEQAKVAKKGWEQLTGGKPQWENMDAVQAEAATGRKTPVRDSESSVGDADAPNL
jgi:hypothetical protein